MRRIPKSVLALTLLLLCTARASAVVIVSAPKLEAGAGGEVEVPIIIKGAKGLSALQMRLTYDPTVLEVVKDAEDPDKGITKGKILPDKAIAKVFTNTPGKLPIVFLGGADPGTKELFAIEEDGTLLTIRFKVIGRSGQKTELTLEKAEAFQKNDMDMVVRTETGELTVTHRFPWGWLCLAAAMIFVVILVVIALALRLLFRRNRQESAEPVAALAAPKVKMKPCPRCGNLVQKGSSFCSSCGAKFVQKQS